MKIQRVQVKHIAHARCNNGAVAVFFFVFNSGLPYNVIKLFCLRYKLAGDKSLYFQSVNVSIRGTDILKGENVNIKKQKYF